MSRRRPLLRVAQLAVVVAMAAVLVAALGRHGPRHPAAGVARAAGARSFPPGPGAALAPGVVTLAHATTPDGPVAVRLYRAQFGGGTVLCIEQVPQGNGQCISEPIGPGSRHAQASRDLWRMEGGHGSCSGRPFQVITAIVLRPGLTAWLRTGAGAPSRMLAVRVPAPFAIGGPLVYATVTHGGDTILLRDAHGAEVLSEPALTPGPPGYCHGLNPETLG